MKKTNPNDQFLEKRMERQRKIRRRRLKAFFVFFVILLLVIGVILSLTVLFPIANLTAKGSKVYTSAQIVKSCGIEKGDNLFAISKKGVLNTLKKKLPYIETVELERSLPDTLNIKVTDAKEYACYEVKGKFYTVSQSGWVLNSSTSRPENVILIKYNDVKCKVGAAAEFKEEVSHELTQNIIDQLLKNKISVNYVDLTDNASLKVKIENRFIVNFGTSADLDNKIKHLMSMIKEIDQKATGNINLSMWNSQNTQGTFVQTDIK